MFASQAFMPVILKTIFQIKSIRMSQSQVSNQYDDLLNQIDLNDNASKKRRVILVIVLSLLLTLSYFVYSELSSLNESQENNSVNTSPTIYATSELLHTPEKANAYLINDIEEDDEIESEVELSNTDNNIEEDDDTTQKTKINSSPNDIEDSTINPSRIGLSNRNFTASEVANIPTAMTINNRTFSKNTSASKPAKTKTSPEKDLPKIDTPAPKQIPEAKDEIFKPLQASKADVKVLKDVAEAAPKPEGINKKAAFPGGEIKMLKFIAKHTSYPSKALANKVEGRVSVSIQINEQGEIISSEIVKGLSPDCDKEVLRVISKMPNWEPALNNGEPINQVIILPVQFKLNK